MIGQPVRCTVEHPVQSGGVAGLAEVTIEIQVAGEGGCPLTGAVAHHVEPMAVTPFTSVFARVNRISNGPTSALPGAIEMYRFFKMS